MLSGCALLFRYLGILSIGPGRYSDSAAVRSSTDLGRSLIRSWVIPSLSN